MTNPSNDQSVLSERIIEHEIVIPKRVVREEVFEKIFIVPETIVTEEIVEEVQRIRETIVEVAKPVIREKIVEVPQVEYRDNLIEKVEKVYEKKIKEVPKIEYLERFVEVPKYVDYQGNVIETPEVEVRETVIERVVEVPEVREQITVRKIQVPKYSEKVITPDSNTSINIPVPVEAVTTYDYQLKHPTPVLNEVDYPVYVPRFIEIPISAQFLDASQINKMQQTNQKLKNLMYNAQTATLPEIENMATEIRQQPIPTEQASAETFKQNIVDAWKNGNLTMITPTFDVIN